MELILLMAIAYAGARGVEAIAGDAKQYKNNKAAERAVKNIAKNKTASGEAAATKDKGVAPAAAAPKMAKFGGGVATVGARGVVNSRTWGEAWLEGFRQRFPEARAEAERRVAERAARRAEKAGKPKKEKESGTAGTGPSVVIPPKPADPPVIPGAADPASSTPAPPKKEEPSAAGPSEADIERKRADDAEARAEQARKEAEQARKEADEAREQARRDAVLAAQKEAREAREEKRLAEERANAAEERERAAARTPDEPDGRPRLSVVPPPRTGTRPGTGTGDPMATSIIPEIRTLDGLLNALALIKAMCQMRAEEAEAIAADDATLANRLDTIEAELADLEVDEATRTEIAELRESIAAQSKAAAQYGEAAVDAADMAVATAGAARKGHAGIAEAVQSSPVEKAAAAGYYER